MGYKDSLGVENDYIFSKEIDEYFLSIGFYRSHMSPRFFGTYYYDDLNHDKACLRFDGDWDHDGHGVQRVFMNEDEIYVERQTSYRSFDSASHRKFETAPSSLKEIEDLLDDLVEKYER